jgi:hypothetical protein
MKDPETVRITNIERAGARNFEHEGQVRQGVVYRLLFNAKNSYGGYTGVDSAGCRFSLDEETFIKVIGL